MRTLGIALIAMVVVGFALSGLAATGVIIPESCWPGLVVASSVHSLSMLLLFFSPSLLAGIGIDVFLIWPVVASTWRPSVI